MTYTQAVDYLERKLPRSPKIVFRDGRGFKRAQKLMSAIGEPQNQLKVVHVAGTSGKGTTAMMISNILSAHGFKTGLTVSPYVYDIRERCQINNRLIPKAKFAQAFSDIAPIVDSLRKGHGAPTYFEVIIALAFKVFLSSKVDYAVVETGLGGLWDATNTATSKDKLCTITRIGIDHTDILGKTKPEIARHKAGIIQPRNEAVILRQSPPINKVFVEHCQKQQAKLHWVWGRQTNVFLNGRELKTYNRMLSGDFQNENFALAMKTLKTLAERDSWQLKRELVQQAIRQIVLPGRREMFSRRGKYFLLDGAHNPQKLEALLDSIKNEYPQQDIGMIYGLKESKEIPKMKGVKQIVATTTERDLQDMSVPLFSAEILASKLKAKNRIMVMSATTVKQAISYALNSDIKVWVVTGTFLILPPAKKVLKGLGH